MFVACVCSVSGYLRVRISLLSTKKVHQEESYAMCLVMCVLLLVVFISMNDGTMDSS